VKFDTMRNTGQMLMTFVTFALPSVVITDPTLPLERIPLALVITALFGIAGYISRGVTRSGALAGTLLAFILYVAAGPPAFITLLGVFILTWLTTRIGYARKTGLGLAESRKGRRASQVLANVAAAAGFALVGVFAPVFQVAAAAALAEAAADTASSECGQALTPRSYLITTLRRVEVGTDGGISVPGTLAALFASCIIAALAAYTTWIPRRDALFVASAGFLGTIVDSILGATLERRGLLDNNGVNFSSTIAAGLLSLLFLHGR
jgi:uncharacterized protein (TIGR00297 family)